jgi:hypothetical protein
MISVKSNKKVNKRIKDCQEKEKSCKTQKRANPESDEETFVRRREKEKRKIKSRTTKNQIPP